MAGCGGVWRVSSVSVSLSVCQCLCVVCRVSWVSFVRLHRSFDSFVCSFISVCDEGAARGGGEDVCLGSSASLPPYGAVSAASPLSSPLPVQGAHRPPPSSLLPPTLVYVCVCLRAAAPLRSLLPPLHPQAPPHPSTPSRVCMPCGGERRRKRQTARRSGGCASSFIVWRPDPTVGAVSLYHNYGGRTGPSPRFLSVCINYLLCVCIILERWRGHRRRTGNTQTVHRRCTGLLCGQRLALTDNNYSFIYRYNYETLRPHPTPVRLI